MKLFSFYKSIGLRIVACASLLVLLQQSFVQGKLSETSLNFTITNTYTGALTPLTGNFVYSSGIFYVSGTSIPVVVGASIASTFYAKGTVTTGQSVSGTGSFSLSTTIVSTTGDGVKSFGGYFLSNFEVLDVESFSVFLDDIPPSQPSIVAPVYAYNAYSTGLVELSWTPSIDTGVGLSYYVVSLFSNPLSLVPDVVYQTTSTSIVIPLSLLPVGSLSWHVAARDSLGFVSVSSMSLFYTSSSGVTSGGVTGPSGGGGGLVILTVDDCPLGDLSSSYYDRLCEAAGGNTGGNIGSGNTLGTGSFEDEDTSLLDGIVDQDVDGNTTILEDTQSIVFIRDQSFFDVVPTLKYERFSGFLMVDLIPLDVLESIVGVDALGADVLKELLVYDVRGPVLRIFYHYYFMSQYRRHVAYYKERFGLHACLGQKRKKQTKKLTKVNI